jgi:hypothetical protein
VRVSARPGKLWAGIPKVWGTHLDANGRYQPIELQ